VLDDARAGIALPARPVPTLAFAAEHDVDVPPDLTHEAAEALGWNVVDVRGASHVGPLLGRSAASSAEQAAAWCRRVFVDAGSA